MQSFIIYPSSSEKSKKGPDGSACAAWDCTCSHVLPSATDEASTAAENRTRCRSKRNHHIQTSLAQSTISTLFPVVQLPAD